MTPRPADFYKNTLLVHLDSQQIFDLMCIIDDGLADELMEIIAEDCRKWFPRKFGPIIGQRLGSKED